MTLLVSENQTISDNNLAFSSFELISQNSRNSLFLFYFAQFQFRGIMKTRQLTSNSIKMLSFNAFYVLCTHIVYIVHYIYSVDGHTYYLK